MTEQAFCLGDQAGQFGVVGLRRQFAIVLGQAFFRAVEDPLAQLQRLAKLVAARADAPEADLVLGEAALEAKLWGKARGHLLAAVKHSPSSRLYRLLPLMAM